MNEKNIENKDFFSPSNLTVLDNNADLENSVENIEVALNEEIQNPLPDFDISDTFNQKSPEVVSVSFRPYTPYQNIKDFSPLHDVIFKQQIFPDFLFNPELTHDQEIPLDFMSRNEIAELFKYAAEKLISLDVTPDDIFDILESTFQKINTAPTAVDNTATVAEDGTLIISIATLLSNDSDIDGDALLAANFSIVGSSNGSVSVQDGNVIFTPNANYNGPASFTYQIADGQGGTDTATTNITVTPVNDAPVAVDDTATVAEDGTLTISIATLLGNDSDIDGDALLAANFSLVGSSNGSVSVQDGHVIFTPNANYNGPASFTYQISDGHGGTDTATTNITVTPVNDAPTAVDNTATVAEDGTLIISIATLLSNDSDIDGDALLAANFSLVGSSNGSVSVQDGHVIFTPNANYNGPASFTYQIADGQGGTDTATTNITVTPVNDAPVAVDDTATVAEDGTLIISIATLLGNDSDIDGDALLAANFSIVGSSNGSVSVQDGNVIFTPNSNYNGPASFTYQIADGQGGTDTATTNITVTPVNDAPTAVDDTATVAEDGTLTISIATLLGNDSDIDGDALLAANFSIVGSSNGSVSVQDGNVIFTPNSNYNGPASFTYQIADGQGGTDTATTNITVTPVNDAPTAVDDTATVAEDGTLIISIATLLGNDSDIDGDALLAANFSIVGSSNGSVSVQDGNVIFTPNSNYNGPASFTYQIADGQGGTDTATTNITVTPVNDAPTAVDDTATVAEDGTLTISIATLLGNDSDIDGDALLAANFSIVGSTNGSVSVQDGHVIFTPNANYNGPASFTYQIADGHGGTDTATTNITVTPVNDAPTAVDNTATVAEDGTLTISIATLLGNDSDIDGDALLAANFSLVGSSNGSVSVQDGHVIFTPNANYNGPASFTYQIADGQGGTDTATTNITVTPVNDAPTAVDDTATVAEDGTLIISIATLLGNDSDIDGDALLAANFSIVGSTNGSVSVQDGHVIFTPNANYNGPASFTYQISDGHGGTDTATTNITVTPVNDAPTAVDNTATVAEDGTLIISIATLLGNDSDIDGDALLAANFSLVGSSNGSVSVQDGNVIFTPNANYNGPASFTYQIADGQGGTDTATTNITVTPEVVHQNSYVFLSKGLSGGYTRDNWTTDAGTGAVASSASGAGTVAKYYNLENATDLNAYNQADQSGHKPLSAATCTLKDTEYNANTDTLTVRIDDNDSSKIKNIEIGMDYDTVDNLNIRAFEDVLIKFLESDNPGQHAGQDSNIYVRDATRLDVDLTKALGDVGLTLETKGTPNSINAHANIEGSSHDDYFTVSDNGSLDNHFTIQFNANDGADRLIIEPGFLTSLNVDMGSGNDAIFMESATGTLHGGSGTDILYLSEDAGHYNITNNNNGTYTITGESGMNMIYDSIEQIVYSANMNNIANAGG